MSDQAPEEAPAAGPVSGLASDAAPVTDDTDPGRPAEAGGNEADLDEDGDGSRIDTPVAEAKDASAPEAEAGALAPTAGSQPVQDQLPDALTASVAVDLSQTVQLPDGPNGLPDFQLNSDIALGVELAADLDSDFASPIEGVDLSDPLLEMPALEIVSPAHLATPAPVSTVEEDVAQLLEAVAIASPAEDFEPDIGVVAPLEAPELADVSHAADSISRPLDDLDVGGLGL